jgi:hypothetical protein
MPVTNLVKEKVQAAYHYLFQYDRDRLSLFSQNNAKILRRLSQAYQESAFVLITYQNGKNEIGQITKQLSISRFVLRNLNHNDKMLKIVDLNDIFRVDLA